MYLYQRSVETLPATDVMVVGAGAAGCCAAISAAEAGASVTLVERYGSLGGVSTGVLDTFYGFYTPGERSIRVVDGVPGRIVERLFRANAAFERPNSFGAGTGVTYSPEILKRVYERMCLESGVRILLHTFFTDTVVEQGRVAGVILDSKAGLQRLDANVVIDCSGDADVAARAGAPFEKAGIDGPVQTATTTFRVCNVDPIRAAAVGRRQFLELMHGAAASGDYDLPRLDGSIHRTPTPGVMLAIMSRIPDLDATDPVDLTRAEIEGRRQVGEYVRFLRERVPGYERAELIATSAHIGVRESRRILGEYWLTADDVTSARRHEDDVALCGAPIEDHHSGTDTNWQYLPDGEVYGIPYRSLLPRSVENLLVAGKCLSASHEAHASARNMAQCMAMGQASGVAGALSLARGETVRNISREALRDRLVDMGSILEWPAVASAGM